MRGFHQQDHPAVDTGIVPQWGETVRMLRGLRSLKIGSIAKQMLPALSALTGLSSLDLGIRHSQNASPSVVSALAGPEALNARQTDPFSNEDAAHHADDAAFLTAHSELGSGCACPCQAKIVACPVRSRWWCWRWSRRYRP